MTEKLLESTIFLGTSYMIKNRIKLMIKLILGLITYYIFDDIFEPIFSRNCYELKFICKGNYFKNILFNNFDGT